MSKSASCSESYQWQDKYFFYLMKYQVLILSTLKIMCFCSLWVPNSFEQNSNHIPVLQRLRGRGTRVDGRRARLLALFAKWLKKISTTRGGRLTRYRTIRYIVRVRKKEVRKKNANDLFIFFLSRVAFLFTCSKDKSFSLPFRPCWGTSFACMRWIYKKFEWRVSWWCL